MIAAMIVVFVIGYLLIALEHPLHINKATFALLTCGIMWSIYALMGDNPHIHVRYNVSLQEFIGEGELQGLKFFDKKEQSEFTVETNNVFVAIGQIPCNNPFKDLVE